VIEHRQLPVTPENVKTLKALENRFLVKASSPNRAKPDFIDVYQVSVKNCFIPLDFNEELPLYLLDVGDKILILFGQWLYDPHMLIVPDSIFENWDNNGSFFGKFSLSCSVMRGIVLSLTVEGSSYIPAQRLSHRLKFKKLHELQLINRSGQTLIDDLRGSGIVESVG